jgi:hypothetical protein
MAKYARFTADYGRRIKSTVDMFQPKGVPAAAPSRADILSGYSSPVEITEDWEEDENGLWKCKAKRLFRTDGTYQARGDGPEIDLWDPCGTGKPSPAAGDKVFAVWRGVWELVSTPGGGENTVSLDKMISSVTYDQVGVTSTCFHGNHRNDIP